MKSLCFSLLALSLVYGVTAAEMTPEERRAAALKAAGLTPSAPKPAASSAGQPAMKTGAGGLATVEFPVTGMMCNNCVANVESAFMKAEGVSAAKPDMANNKTVVTYDTSKTDLDKILAAFMANKARRFDAAKPGETIKGPVYTYSGKEETLSGSLAIKGKDAPADVVCRVVARRGGEQGERAFNVITSDAALRTKIEEARSKGEQPKLVGVVSEKGITVTAVQ